MIIMCNNDSINNNSSNININNINNEIQVIMKI